MNKKNSILINLAQQLNKLSTYKQKSSFLIEEKINAQKENDELLLKKAKLEKDKQEMLKKLKFFKLSKMEVEAKKIKNKIEILYDELKKIDMKIFTNDLKLKIIKTKIKELNKSEIENCYTPIKKDNFSNHKCNSDNITSCVPVQSISELCDNIDNAIELDDDIEKEEVLEDIIKFIEYSEEIEVNDELICMLRNLLNLLSEKLYRDSSMVYKLPDIICFLKKIKFVASSNKEMCKELKEIIESFSKLNIEMTEVDTEDKGYFEIFKYCLQSDKNVLYIKEIIKRIPSSINSRYYEKDLDRKVRDNKSKHVIQYIVDLYIENFKKMVKKEEHVNLHYLKEIYFSFTKSYHFRISDDEKREIDDKLKDFSLYVKNTLIKRNRKKVALDDIKKMKTSRFSYVPTIYMEREYSDDFFTNQRFSTSTYMKNMIEGYKLRNKPVISAFLIGNNAYSISYNGNTTILTIHAIATHFVTEFDEPTKLQNYLYDCHVNKTSIDDFLGEVFEYKVDNEYPTIAYSLHFSERGQVNKISINQSIVSIERRIKPENIKEDESEIYKLYKKSLNSYHKDEPTYDLYYMNTHFKDVLNKFYLDFINKEKLPFIYYGYSMPTDANIENNLYHIASSLHKINKGNSAKIKEIFTKIIDKPHYSTSPFENGIHKFDLVDSFNFMGVMNQRMLVDLYLNKNVISIERNKTLSRLSRNIFARTVQDLNKNIGDNFNYNNIRVDQSVLESSHDRLRLRKY